MNKEVERKNNLVGEAGSSQLTATPALNSLEIAQLIPQSAVWLSNFISLQTRRSYQTAIREFIFFAGLQSDQDWGAVSRAMVIAWRDSLISAGLSAQTVNNRLSALSSLFLHLCSSSEDINKNPVDGVKRKPVNTDQVKSPVLTTEQVRLLLDAPEQHAPSDIRKLRDTAILYTYFYTGCRVNEAGQLKVRDFFDDAGYSVLEFTIKGGKRNKIAIHQELKIAIHRYLQEAGHGQEMDLPLFLPTKGVNRDKHLSSRMLNKLFNKYVALAGLPVYITPHSARASFITQALERKCPIEAVQRSVGHCRIGTTQSYDKRLLRHKESASFAVVY